MFEIRLRSSPQFHKRCGTDGNKNRNLEHYSSLPASNLLLHYKCLLNSRQNVDKAGFKYIPSAVRHDTYDWTGFVRVKGPRNINTCSMKDSCRWMDELEARILLWDQLTGLLGTLRYLISLLNFGPRQMLWFRILQQRRGTCARWAYENIAKVIQARVIQGQ